MKLRGAWRSYAALLELAAGQDYEIVSLDGWVRRAAGDDVRRRLIVRHDVDRHPASALTMAGIEGAMGLTGTWYFRWRTANPRAVEAVLAGGGTAGLHYETLSRLALERGLTQATPELVGEARDVLQDELDAFRSRWGPARSACPHGDTRAPGFDNAALLRDQEPAAFGLDFDGNDVMRGREELAAWVTDRPGGRTWKAERDPQSLIRSGRGPIFAVVHPNNWSARPALALDRAARHVLPGALSSLVRSGTDEPPR